MACSENKNPLKRGGTDRNQRLLDGLSPGYANIEGRDEAEWIVFAAKFSAYLKYYNNSNTAEGDWRPFFENNISAVLGSIAIQNIDEYRLEIKTRFVIIKNDEISLINRRENLSALFADALTFAKALDGYLLKVPTDNGFRNTIQNLIRSKLQPAIQKLLKYYKGAKSLGLLKDKDYPEIKILNLPVIKASSLISEGLSNIWITVQPDWTSYFAQLPEETGIFGDPAWDKSEKINHAANHNLFSVLFDQFLMSFSNLIKDAETALIETLTNWNGHQPHYALFLSFLRLFRFAKDSINTLTDRHLDFYYKEVLRLEPQKPVPDKAHVLIELANHINQYSIAKNTLFKAGKDSEGKDLYYALDQDTVFNKAKVARLMSVYKGNAEDNIQAAAINDGRLFASPFADSADGLGKEIKTEFKEWHPFVHKTYSEGVVSAVNMPKADIGFAVASHYLALNEGERRINIKLGANFTSAQLSSINQSDCYLTTEKGWLKVADKAWTTGIISGTATASALLVIKLTGDLPAITNYNAKVHGGNYTTELPLLKVILRHTDSSAYPYNLLNNLFITHVEVDVRVGVENNYTLISGGLKNLLLKNDVGVLDASKPFLPFGQFPKAGASFIIGNEEVFKKKNAEVSLNLQWLELPTSTSKIDYDVTEGNYYPDASFTYLGQGQWKNLSPANVNFLNGTNSNALIPTTGFQSLSAVAGNNETILSYTDEYLPYGTESIKGFLKLTLNAGFGYEEHQKAYTAYLIKLARGTAVAADDPGIAPYVPKLKSITLHYRAYTVSNLTDAASFTSRELQFFNVYPFGDAELHKGLVNSDISLVPQFIDPGNGDNNIAEFYVGIENLKADESVNILFQLLEGTANPKLDKPEEHVSWSYFSNNVWKKFTTQQITDNTDQLLKSGIISFIIPADATTGNTILPAGFIWLRSSVTESAEAVCKLLSVSAQATVVVLKPGSPEFSVNTLPAGTISKLKESTSSVKKIEQPYSSFGGKSREKKDQYYVRVSERLRHKARAITIWDYEHLVLSTFPGIYKVKCLNHTKLIGTDYNEVAPGHVTVITIPDLKNRNDANPLRPYTGQDLLVEIKKFLQKKISCHVQLHTGQPQFEEVYLEFELKLHDNLEFNFYRDLLKEEITKFLTPWAYGVASSIDFGGKVHKSVLINFIEEQSYVDYITNVFMYHRIDENAPLQKTNTNTDLIEASTARSILVSAPASKHDITAITVIEEVAKAEDCIDEYNSAQ